MGATEILKAGLAWIQAQRAHGADWSPETATALYALLEDLANTAAASTPHLMLRCPYADPLDCPACRQKIQAIVDQAITHQRGVHANQN